MPDSNEHADAPRTSNHWFVRGRYDGEINAGTHVVARFVLPVFAYLAMFVGTGFLSGAIVHSGERSEIPRNAVIGLIGVALFVAGSTYFEAVVLQHRITRRTLGSFLVFSSLLSVGIGMISGGVQHFTDFPSFAPKLIPLGLLVATFAFAFKHRVDLRGRWWATVSASTIALCLAVFALTTTLAQPYVADAAAGKGGHGHGHGGAAEPKATHADEATHEDQKKHEDDAKHAKPRSTAPTVAPTTAGPVTRAPAAKKPEPAAPAPAAETGHTGEADGHGHAAGDEH